jgi:Uncharacterized conserved protein
MEIMGKKIKAEYLTDKAPDICNAMDDCLPADCQAIHAKFAGREIIIMVPFYSEPANEILDVKPGDIGYYPGRQTICVFYGDTMPFGKVSVFAKVTQGLEDLHAIGDLILDKGVIQAKITGFKGGE